MLHRVNMASSNLTIHENEVCTFTVHKQSPYSWVLLSTLFIWSISSLPTPLVAKASCQNYHFTELQDTIRKVLFSSAELTGNGCYRIPAITKALNGDLLAIADMRMEHCGDLRSHHDINLVLRRSDDNGLSWGLPQILVDYPEGISASDPSFIVDPVNERIHLFFNKMDHLLAPAIYEHMVMYSDNHGLSWSRPRNISGEIVQPEWRKDFVFITSGNGFCSEDGILFHTLVHVDFGVKVFYSDDMGTTWKTKESVITPADESKIIIFPDGQWWINSRVNGRGFRVVHRSIDEGMTWDSSIDSSMVDPGCNAALLFTKDGQRELLFVVNAYHSFERVNLTLHISDDRGVNWKRHRVINEGKSAYSSMVSQERDMIGILAETGEYQTIEYFRIPLPWIERLE